MKAYTARLSGWLVFKVSFYMFPKFEIVMIMLGVGI
jgi:hypothetical protein